MESRFYILNSLAMTHRDISGGLREIGGLSGSGYRILLRISESESGLRVTEISTDLELKFAAVSSAVDVLVKNGSVLRSADPSDKRALRLVISEKGNELLARIDETLLDRLRKRWEPLSKEHLDTMLVDLGKAHLTSEYVASVEASYAAAEEVLKKRKLSYTQCLILALLALHPVLRPVDIAHRLEQKPTTVSVAMNALEEHELITRNKSSMARSMVDISITQKGKELIEEAVEAAFVALQELDRFEQSEERKRLTYELTRLIGDVGPIR